MAAAIDRISAVAGQLSSPKQGKARLLEKNPDDVSPPTFSYYLPARFLVLSLLHLLTRPPLLLGRRDSMPPNSIHKGWQGWIQGHHGL